MENLVLLNNGGSLLKIRGGTHDYTGDYLTFTALESGTFSFNKSGLSYSTNGGNTWTTLAAGDSTPTIAAGSSIIWKGSLRPSYDSDWANFSCGTFSSTGLFNVEGNVMSIAYSDSFASQDVPKDNMFRILFKQAAVVDASNLILPSMTLTTGCYFQMFKDCTSLTAVPLLPATNLNNNCYQEIFYGCTSLVSVPATLLSATKVLKPGCYNGMFYGCSSLIIAPVLPATDLSPNYCYCNLFFRCYSLRWVKMMGLNNVGSGKATESWMYQVPPGGTFVKNINAKWNLVNAHGVPSGWTIEYASE